MKTFYIAGIVPERLEDGSGWSVYFPDVPNVAAGGQTVEEAISNAEDGLYVALQALAEKNAPIPAPSGMAQVREAVCNERAADGLECPAETVWQYIQAPTLDLVPVRVNITIPRATLAYIDEQAKRHGYTRSAFLAQAALEYADHAGG